MSEDCPTGVLVDLNTSTDNRIQFRRSDILNLDGSSFFSPTVEMLQTSFHEQNTSRNHSSDDETQLLENEKFDFEMPSNIMEDMSPEKSCKQRSSSTKEFSEITVRPPILSPEVRDPFEEIFKEARKIARRLSWQCGEINALVPNTTQTSNRECKMKKAGSEAELRTSPRNVSSRKVFSPKKAGGEAESRTSPHNVTSQKGISPKQAGGEAESRTSPHNVTSRKGISPKQAGGEAESRTSSRNITSRKGISPKQAGGEAESRTCPRNVTSRKGISPKQAGGDVESRTSPNNATSKKSISPDVSTDKRKQTLKLNGKLLKNLSPATKPGRPTTQKLVQTNSMSSPGNIENVENDSRVANTPENMVNKKITVPDSLTKPKETVKRVQDFKKPVPGKERMQRMTAAKLEVTPVKGKPIVRSATLKEKAAAEVVATSPSKHEGSPSGKAKVYRRRSLALTKNELKVVKATKRDRHSSDSSTSSIPGKIPEPILKGLQRPTVLRPITPARLAASKVTTSNETKDTPIKTNGETRTGLPKRATGLMSKIATPSRKKGVLADTSIFATPTRSRAPGTLLATQKLAVPEGAQSTTLLRIFPQFNGRM